MDWLMLAERDSQRVADEQRPWWPSRYGADDQIGSLNEITPAAIVAAARLVREGRVFDLGRILDETVPHFPGRFWRQTLVSNAHLNNPARPEGTEGGWGTNKLGIETVPPIITRGVLVDVARHRGLARMSAGDIIGVDELESILCSQRTPVVPGDAVIFHTGWGSLWDDHDAFNAGEPGIGMAVANWLVEHRVALTGADTWSYGAVPSEDPERPFLVPRR